MTKCLKRLLAVHHWCVCKFKSHQHCDALSFPLSIACQHLLEKGKLQSLHEVNGWFYPAALQILDMVVSKVWCPIADQWDYLVVKHKSSPWDMKSDTYFDISEIASHNTWWDSLHFRTE